jgi:hypothetical protein
MTAKRSYNRRSDEDRIAALQAKISSIQRKLESKQRPDMAVVREMPKLQKRLRDFAQLANHHGRADIANSTIAFIAGLDRMANSPPEPPRRTRRGVEVLEAAADETVV